MAETILLAARIREKSWNSDPDPRNIIGCRYEIAIEKAVSQAIIETKMDPKFTTPIVLMLCNSWNDSLEWANQYGK